jgi:hypothetical protein
MKAYLKSILQTLFILIILGATFFMSRIAFAQSAHENEQEIHDIFETLTKGFKERTQNFSFSKLFSSDSSQASCDEKQSQWSDSLQALAPEYFQDRKSYPEAELPKTCIKSYFEVRKSLDSKEVIPFPVCNNDKNKLLIYNLLNDFSDCFEIPQRPILSMLILKDFYTLEKTSPPAEFEILYKNKKSCQNIVSLKKQIEKNITYSHWISQLESHFMKSQKNFQEIHNMNPENELYAHLYTLSFIMEGNLLQSLSPQKNLQIEMRAPASAPAELDIKKHVNYPKNLLDKAQQIHKKLEQAEGVGVCTPESFPY